MDHVQNSIVTTVIDSGRISIVLGKYQDMLVVFRMCLSMKKISL